MKLSKILSLTTTVVISATVLSGATFATSAESINGAHNLYYTCQFIKDAQIVSTSDIRYDSEFSTSRGQVICCPGASYKDGTSYAIYITSDGTYDGYKYYWKLCSVCGSDNKISSELVKSGMTELQAIAWFSLMTS